RDRFRALPQRLLQALDLDAGVLLPGVPLLRELAREAEQRLAVKVDARVVRVRASLPRRPRIEAFLPAVYADSFVNYVVMGSISRKHAPCGTASSYTRSPPCARAYERAIARPSPVPAVTTREPSPRVKRSKRSGTKSGETPFPSSSTVSRK